MKKQNGESAHDAKENRRYIFVLLGCIAVAAAIGILLWQPKFADTESLSKYEYDTQEQTVSASDAVDDVPAEDEEQTAAEDEADSAQDVDAQDEEDAEQTEQTAAPEENIPKQTAKFYLPMEKAEVSRAFSMDTLSYDKTMDDWRVHGAVDFSGKKGDAVAAISDATVDEIGNDILYGTYIVLRHSDDIKSKYTGIADICVKKGESVSATQKIAVLGEPMPAEAEQGVHLHLEVTKNGGPVDIEKLAE